MTFGLGLLAPATVLIALGWLVPRMLARIFSEGVRPLMLLAFTAAVAMMLLSMLVWLGLYLVQGLNLAEFFALGVGEGLWHLSRLAAASALIWAPIMVLSVAGLPKHWVEETW